MKWLHTPSSGGPDMPALHRALQRAWSSCRHSLAYPQASRYAAAAAAGSQSQRHSDGNRLRRQVQPGAAQQAPMQAGCLSHVCFEPTAASALVAGLEAAAESTFPLRRHGIDARRCYATTAYTRNGRSVSAPAPPHTRAYTHTHPPPNTCTQSLLVCDQQGM